MKKIIKTLLSIMIAICVLLLLLCIFLHIVVDMGVSFGIFQEFLERQTLLRGVYIFSGLIAILGLIVYKLK